MLLSFQSALETAHRTIEVWIVMPGHGQGLPERLRNANFTESRNEGRAGQNAWSVLLVRTHGYEFVISNVDSLRPAQSTIALENLAFTLYPQKGSPGVAAVGVAQHLDGVAKNEPGTMKESRWHMLRFHFAFGSPPHELDLLGTEVFTPNDSRGP